jgi:hypothetical protein
MLGVEVIHVNELCLSPLADKHQALVLDNPQKPCRKFGLALELVNVLECLPTGILGFFFRFAPMAKDGSSQIRTSAAMAVNQLGKCISIALLRQADKLVVHQFDNVISISCHNLHIS